MVPVKVFLSYASPDDDELRVELEAHLSVLRRQGLMVSFHAGAVTASELRDATLAKHITRADVVLLLVSASYLASNHCYEVEMARALQRHQAGEAHVVPVLLRACDWIHAPFGQLGPLPKDGRPIVSRDDRDEGFAEVARGIREVIEQVVATRSGGALSRPLNGASSRVEKVREILQRLRKSSCTGIAMLAPLGFQASVVAGDVLHHLREPGWPLYPVRLVPELQPRTEDRFYERLLRDLRWGLPEEWRDVTEDRGDGSPMDRFELAVENLLSGPVRKEERELLLAIDGLAQAPIKQIERWGFMMARLSKHGLKLLVWGGQELHDLRTKPQTGAHFSVFHELHPVELGLLSEDDVRAMVEERGGDTHAARVVHEETGGHPALVQELIERHEDDARAGSRDTIQARILGSEHVARLRRTAEGDAAVKRLWQALAANDESLVTKGTSPGEERLEWLGVLREVDAKQWAWTAPVMQKLGRDFQ